ncbi:hypothetical protein FSP39_014895 [Pinctada imbricata]|uniref:Bcl-2 Bcl-2 homology region 1-3 domain-containing protein n=1 Tax=Pinctada imbricata TaxID=66713 RepID=A0AA88Y3X2_PINIB|nr:hypothetical protein FSP39_014895 [Pinctada imbricata]
MSSSIGETKSLSGNSFNPMLRGNLFAEVHKQLGLLPGYQGLGQDMAKLDQQTQTPGSSTPEEKVRQIAEVIATDVIPAFSEEEDRKPPNRYCKTMRRTVKELSDRHDIAFKGMVQKLNLNDTNAFPTFVSFAARVAVHCKKQSPDCEEKIALYAGKYVASKLGKWILDNGGWDAFADYFPEKGAMEDKLWKGLMITAMGLGALATVVAAR